MRRVRIVATIYVAVCFASIVRANVCAARRVNVSGVAHGIVADIEGRQLPNFDLRLVDGTGAAVAVIHTDSDGNFQFDFSSLRTGNYEIVTPVHGFAADIGPVDVTRRGFDSRNSLVLTVGVVMCQGSITERRLKSERHS